MKIKEMLDQIRRDFLASMECEGCGHIEAEVSGYDDRYFHDSVIPKMKCKSCKKSREELGLIAEKTPTRYHEGIQL